TLRDSLFLGPPLPLEGRLYAVVETTHPKASDALLLAIPTLAAPSLHLRQNHELRLVTLDAVSGKLLAARTLLSHGGAQASEPYRRIQALPIAHGKGVLVCPTNVGTVFGVELS